MAVSGAALNTSIPMSAQNDMPDALGSMNRGINMRGNMVQRQEDERQITSANDDRAVMQDYLKNGGDLVTPPGVERAANELKGRISPEAYAKLGAHFQDVRQKDQSYKKSLMDMTAKSAQIQLDQTDRVLQALDIPMQVYEKAKGTPNGGESEALGQFEKSRGEILGKMMTAKDPVTGQPMYPPQVTQALQNATPDVVRAMQQGSKYHRAQVESRLKEAQTAHQTASAGVEEARASAYRKFGGLGRPRESDIGLLDDDLKAGRITQDEYNSMKAGMVAKKSGGGGEGKLDPEALDLAATDWYLHRTMPARTGNTERYRIMNRAMQIARENGDTTEEAANRPVLNKARAMALNDITKRAALISTYEKDADKRLGLVTELALKADINGVPAINRWINAGRKEIAGDNDVNNFNSAMISAQAELARILSGALTNAATSDSARAEAAGIINKNMSPDMIKSLVPNIRRELKFKKDSFESEKKELTDEMGTPMGQKGRAQKAANARTPEGEEEMVRIIKKEYADEKKKLEKFDPKDPESADNISLVQGNLVAMKRQLKSLGVKDPDAELAKPVTKPVAGGHPTDVMEILKRNGVGNAKP